MAAAPGAKAGIAGASCEELFIETCLAAAPQTDASNLSRRAVSSTWQVQVPTLAPQADLAARPIKFDVGTCRRCLRRSKLDPAIAATVCRDFLHPATVRSLNSA